MPIWTYVCYDIIDKADINLFSKFMNRRKFFRRYENLSRTLCSNVYRRHKYFLKFIFRYTKHKKPINSGAYCFA